jgi:hypothetical protein
MPEHQDGLQYRYARAPGCADASQRLPRTTVPLDLSLPGSVAVLGGDRGVLHIQALRTRVGLGGALLAPPSQRV